MPELMELINRKDEVKSINNLIQKASKHTVVFLCGDGGLGKTRLLQEIRNTYTNKNNKNKFLVANIIDFDDRSLHTFEGLEIKIARELDIEAEVAEEVRELRKVRSEGATQRIIKIQQEKITNILKNQFNELSKTRRVLLFFDTIEKIEESTLRSLLVLLSHFENGVFLFAGRPSLPSPRSQTNIAQLMKNQFGEDSVIDIEPLDQNKSGEYLRAKLGIDNLKDKWIQNLLPLVEGKPILIELAAEWLSTTQPPDWLLTLSDKDLQTKQKDFAANLVRHITQLRTPMDRLLLVLSRVYPFDVQMAEELLGLSKQDAETLIDSAKTYVFVKTLPGAQITLHDEMRKMVDEFVWPFIDKPGERRRRDSKRAVAIFERRLTKLAEDQENKENAVSNIQSEERRRIERIALTEQLVEHGLYADIDPGFEVFTKTWDEAVNNKDYLFAERMLEIAKPFSDQFTEEQDIHYVLFKARQKNYTGYSGVSLQDLRKYEKRYAKEPIFLSPIYNALGIAERKAGSMKDAADYLSNNLKIAKRTNPDSAPKVANQLGYTYRLMGYSKKAESMYKYGLKLAMEAEDRNKDLIASLLNNLGYIYGIQKKYDTQKITVYRQRTFGGRLALQVR